MNALAAYDAGLSGKGVTIAIVDSGIDTDGAEFAGRVSGDSKSIPVQYARCGSCAGETVNFSLDDVVGHGTQVASVAAGGRNGAGMHGVAPEATILAVKLGSPDFTGIADQPMGTDPKEATNGGPNIGAIPDAMTYAVSKGAFVINLSVNGGTTGAVDPKFFAAMNEVRIADRLVVQSISNFNEDTYTGKLPEYFLGANKENKDWFLFAVRLTPDLKPIDGNGNAGPLADRMLATVAQGILVTDKDGNVVTGTGNSFAAPAVAGAAALLKQNWPQLGGKAIAQILLDSAKDLGDPGVDPVYGKGLLDIAQALKAQAPKVGTSLTTAVPVAGTSLTTSGAFGGSNGASGFTGLVSVDAYGRDYKTDLSVLARGGASSLRIGDLSAPTHVAFKTVTPDRAMGLRDTGGARDLPGSARFALGSTVVGVDVNASPARAPGLALTGDTLRSAGLSPKSAGVSVERDDWRAGFARGATLTGSVERASLAYAVARGVEIEIENVRERGTALGLIGTGAFAVNGASTRLASVTVEREFGGFDLAGRVTVGTARVDTPGTSLLAFGDVGLSAFALIADYTDASGGRWTLGLTSPLRADRASVRGELPVAFDWRAGEVVTAERAIDFSAGAREVDVEAAYALTVPGGHLALGAAHVTNAGHVAGRNGTAAYARLTTSF